MIAISCAFPHNPSLFHPEHGVRVLRNRRICPLRSTVCDTRVPAEGKIGKELRLVLEGAIPIQHHVVIAGELRKKRHVALDVCLIEGFQGAGEVGWLSPNLARILGAAAESAWHESAGLSISNPAYPRITCTLWWAPSSRSGMSCLLLAVRISPSSLIARMPRLTPSGFSTLI